MPESDPTAVPDPPDDLPTGLVFPGLQDHPKRSLFVSLLAVVAVAGSALIWPVYPLADGLHPYVLGLPLSFAWVVGWLLVVFIALVVFYAADEAEPSD